MAGLAAHCANFSSVTWNGEGCFLGGPMRLCNAQLSGVQPRVVQSRGPDGALETALWLWKTRDWPAGKELTWSYGARSRTSLDTLLKEVLVLSPCCKVRGNATVWVGAGYGPGAATPVSVGPQVAPAADVSSSISPVATALSQGASLVVVVGSLEEKLQGVLPCILAGARRAGLATLKMLNPKQLRARKGRSRV